MSTTTDPSSDSRQVILEALFAGITDSLLVLDKKMVVVDANASLLERLGRERKQVVGQRWEDLFPHLAETGRAGDLQTVLQEGLPHRGRIPLLDAAGTALLFDVTTYPIRDVTTGQVTHLVEYAHEVTEEVKLQLQIVDANKHLLVVKEQLEAKTAERDAANSLLEEKCALLETINTQLEQLAVVDVMTQLPNHRAFQEQLVYEVSQAERRKRPFSLILFDVDNFKQYNDRFGHPAGDLLLSQVAELVRLSIRAVDLPARYGGEEFTILLPETDKYGAAVVAERLRAAVASHPFNGQSVRVSLGIAEFPLDAKTGSELVTCADKAMYYSKSRGKNAVSLCQPLSSDPSALEFSALQEHAVSSDSFQSVPGLPQHLSAGSASGKCLLLVDADKPSLETMRDALRERGYAVACAATGQEALRTLSNAGANFDMVLTDIVLPDRSGYALQAEARVLSPGLPFIFLSTLAGAHLIQRAHCEEENNLITKPCDLDMLIHQVSLLANRPENYQARFL